jgi:hypothetical protein
MESAFGVDHGEVSKAIPGFGALGAKIAGGTMKAGQGMRRTGANAMSQGRQRMGSAVPGSRPHAFGQGLQSGGAARVKMGGQLKKLGQGMQKRPGLTGGIAAGGAAAGVGGGAAAIGNRRRF